MIDYYDILSAGKRISPYIYNTPIEKSYFLSGLTGGEVFLKLECQQVMKSFKIRGALNKILGLSPKERRQGIAAASSGNHGAAVSYAASIVGIENAEVYIPDVTPIAKRQKIERYGAKLAVQGKCYDEAYAYAKKIAKEKDLVWIDSCSDEDVIAGQGTVGIEVMHEVPRLDTIIVPIGGGSIITGVAIAAKTINPSITIIGVQTEACPAMLASIRDSTFYEEYPTEASICEALVGGVGEIPYKMAKKCIDEVLLVKEDTIKKAVQLLVENEKILAEPSACVGIACLMQYRKRFKGCKAATIVTGGNIDSNLLKKLIGGIDFE